MFFARFRRKTHRFVPGICFLAGVFACATAFAEYRDGISASAEEVYQAAREVLRPAGFRTEDKKNYVLESRWIEDTVTRARSWPFLGQTHQTYARRYRIRFRIQPMGHYTEVGVKAVFQYQRGDLSQRAVWRNLKPSREDLRLERLYFEKVLEQIAAQRKAPKSS